MNKRLVRGLLLGAVLIVPLAVILPDASAQSGYLGADSLAISPIHHLVFSGSGASGFCAYAEMQDHGALAVAPSTNDFRLVPCQGKSAFSLVTDADVAEKGYASGAGNTAPNVRTAFADVNANGNYDPGDGLYLTTGGGSTLVATTSAESFTLRLTSVGGNVGGSWVLAGDSDLVSYQNVAPGIVASWAWTDEDSNGLLSDPDGIYILPGYGPGYPAGTARPINAVPLRLPHAATPTPTASGPVTGGQSMPVSPVWHLQFGSSDATDDCAYAELHEVYGPQGPHPMDLRLVPCNEKTRWSLVSGSDASEVNYNGAGKSVPVVRLAYADVNANGAFDTNDGIYLTTGTDNQLPGTTSPTSFTIRMMSPDASQPGRWALPGDPDIVSYGASAPPLTGSWAWVDEDRTNSLSEGDEVYLLPTTAPGYAKGSPLPSNSILFHAAAMSHADCYHPDYGFYDCQNPPTGVGTATPTPSGPTPTPTPPSGTPQPTNTGRFENQTNAPVEPYNVPFLGPAGAIAAVGAAGGATAFFRRRH